MPLLLGLGRPALEGLADTASVAVRALPPLLAVLPFLSLASETSQAFGRLEGWRFGAVLTLFGCSLALILSAGPRGERRAPAAPGPGPDLLRDVQGTPAAPLAARGVVPAAPPLERMARLNLAVSLLVPPALRVLAVGVVVGATFLALGGVAALHFSAVALGEERYRRDFLEDELARARRVMAAWPYYPGAMAPAAPRGPGRGPAARA